jgi:predicted PurR-regulated permease PerM
MKVAALVVVTLLTLYLLYRILEPFCPAIVWGIALAIVAQPLHRRLCVRVRKDNLAAGISVLLVTAILVVPAIIVTHQVIVQSTKAGASAPVARDTRAVETDVSFTGS